MFQCKVRTEPERISGKWVEVMNAGERERSREILFLSTVLSTAKMI